MTPLPLALLLLAASPDAAAPSIAATDIPSLAQAIMAAIKPCWAPPKLPVRTITTVRAHYNADGSLASVPELLDQTPVPEAYRAQAGELVLAAKRAVVRCAPVRLPAELYRGGWDDIELRMAAGMP
jgi:hypothetical protein